MPHEGCQQHGCWLNQFCTKFLPNLPAPKFYLGQTVECAWFNEERDAWVFDRGLIVGLQFHPPEALTEEWWYTVEITHLNGEQSWLEPGYQDLMQESELRVVESPAVAERSPLDHLT